MIRFKIDWENCAGTFWGAARERDDVPDVLMNLIHDPHAETAEALDNEGERAIQWLESVDGWNDGPEYAPTALIVERL